MSGPDVFDALAAEAAALEGGAAAPGAAPGAAVVDPLPQARAEAAEVVELLAAVALPLLALKSQRLADAYGAAERARIADALAAVSVKRGWSVAGALGQYGPELALAAALAGPALPIVLDELRRRREAPAAAPGAPGAAPAAPVEAPAPPPVPEVREWSVSSDGRVQ